MTSYYIDAEPGVAPKDRKASDLNDGLSPDRPWKTLRPALKLLEGDVVAPSGANRGSHCQE